MKYFFAFCLKYQKFYFNLWNIPCLDRGYVNSQKSKLTKMEVLPYRAMKLNRTRKAL